MSANQNNNGNNNKKSTIMKQSGLRKLISETMREMFNEESDEDTRPAYTPDQKRKFVEAIQKFNSYGGEVYRKTDVSKSCKHIKLLVEFASRNLVEESGEWFDNVTAARHSKRLQESMKVFEKTAGEVTTLQQRLESAYEDIGEILSKYYDVRNDDGKSK